MQRVPSIWGLDCLKTTSWTYGGAWMEVGMEVGGQEPRLYFRYALSRSQQLRAWPTNWSCFTNEHEICWRRFSAWWWWGHLFPFWISWFINDRLASHRHQSHYPHPYRQPCTILWMAWIGSPETFLPILIFLVRKCCSCRHISSPSLSTSRTVDPVGYLQYIPCFPSLAENSIRNAERVRVLSWFFALWILAWFVFFLSRVTGIYCTAHASSDNKFW